MKQFRAHITVLIAALFAAAIVHGQTQPEVLPQITLKTDPEKVLAGQEFELIWRVSVDDAEIVKVFVDCADAPGPEHTWEHDGDGAFEAKVKHVEKTSGMKEYELWAKITKGSESRFAGESFKINVLPAGGDKDLEAFLSWMKDMGYSEDVIHVYTHDGSNPAVRELWNKYFTMRKEESIYRELETMPILFLDLLATEEEAINQPLKGQTAKLEEYLAHIYGKPFKIEYLEQRVSYESLFGEPLLQKNAKGSKWLKFNPIKLNKYARETAKRIIAERQLPENAVIIHWAPKKWKYKGEELKIQDHTGSSPALSGMGFGLYGLGTYAHEWGHGLGLGHMFVVGPGSYSSRTWGLDCIMNHTYVPYSNPKAGRLLSPLGRYALEPRDGYLDQKTFAAEYSKAMAGTEHLKRRLADAQTGVSVVSTMSWSTPWNSLSRDSVICQGLKNRNYEIKKLELQPGIESGTYSLLFDEAASSGPSKTMILKKDGKRVASTRVAWLTKISYNNHYEISFPDYLSFAIGKPKGQGGSTLAGIGKLLNGKILVVPGKR